MQKKAFVSGCFDMLHSGHVAFLQEAAGYGELYVALGSDGTVAELKGRPPVNPEVERQYMVEAVAWVHAAFVSSGSGHIDFRDELAEIRPDYFVVNEDGSTAAKAALCRELGVEYVVLERRPYGDLAARSTTQLRTVERMPYRIDLAGGWLDQPFVSRVHPGAVITLSIEPDPAFTQRGGLASSTRQTAMDLWGGGLPAGEPVKLAKTLFCCDNPPGTDPVSGAQDAIGIVYPGLARSYFAGQYWPSSIEQLPVEPALRFVESHLYLVPLGPRPSGYDVLGDARVRVAPARALAEAADECWRAIMAEDAVRLGQAVRDSFEAQCAMFPAMITEEARALIDGYRERILGWKITGAGGGGYLVLVSSEPVESALRPRARRVLL